MYKKETWVFNILISHSIFFQQREYQLQQLLHMLPMQLAEDSQQQRQATLDLVLLRQQREDWQDTMHQQVRILYNVKVWQA